MNREVRDVFLRSTRYGLVNPSTLLENLASIHNHSDTAQEYRDYVLGEWGQPASALYNYFNPIERRDTMTFIGKPASDVFLNAQRFIRNIWNRTGSNSATLNCYIPSVDTWQTEAMMYLYQTRILLHSKTHTLTNDAINSGASASTIRVNPRASASTPNPDVRVLKLVHINKGKNIFKYFDDNYKDEELKSISLGLQTDRNHSIRVHKINPKLIIIMSSEFTESTIRQIIALMPILFDLEVSPEIKEICKHYGAGRYEEWLTAWETYITSLNLGEQERKEALKKLCSSHKEKRISTATKEYKGYQSDIESYERHLATLYQKIRTAELTLMGFELEDNIDDTTLYNFITNNKFIKDFQYNGSEFTCFITAPLSYYDLELLKPYYKSSRSIITQDADIADLFDACFISRTHQMWCGSEIIISPANNSVEAKRSQRPPLYLGQPHLSNFNCWGTNKALIGAALAKADYIELLSIVIAATQNYNFADTAVLDRWIDTIRSNSNVPFIYNKETKKYMSYNEFKETIHATDKTDPSTTTGIDATVPTDSIIFTGPETDVRIQNTDNTQPDFF